MEKVLTDQEFAALTEKTKEHRRTILKVLHKAGSGERVAVPAWQGVMQPTFSSWPMQDLASVREALVEQGLGGPKQLLERLPHAVVEWEPAEPPPFFNVNTPADLAAARGWLDRPGD